MNKLQLTRKKLIKEGIMLALATLMLGGGVFYFSIFNDDTQSELQSKQGMVNGLNGELSTIRADIGNGNQVSRMFDQYVKQHNESFLLDREAATALLAKAREKNQIVDLTATFSPIADLKPDLYAPKTGILVKSEVKVSFGALTDNSVFGFISSLQSMLPGIVVVQDMTISGGGQISKSILVDLSQKKLTPLVKAEMTLLWYGIRPDTKQAGAKP